MGFFFSLVELSLLINQKIFFIFDRFKNCNMPPPCSLMCSYGKCVAYLVESHMCLTSSSAHFMLQLIFHPTSALSFARVSLILTQHLANWDTSVTSGDRSRSAPNSLQECLYGKLEQPQEQSSRCLRLFSRTFAKYSPGIGRQLLTLHKYQVKVWMPIQKRSWKYSRWFIKSVLEKCE